MKAIQAQGFSIDQLRVGDLPVPTPARGDILVRVRAASLNYRDLAVLSGTYLQGLPLPYIPVSDAAGVPPTVVTGLAAMVMVIEVEDTRHLAELRLPASAADNR